MHEAELREISRASPEMDTHEVLSVGGLLPGPPRVLTCIALGSSVILDDGPVYLGGWQQKLALSDRVTRGSGARDCACQSGFSLHGALQTVGDMCLS